MRDRKNTIQLITILLIIVVAFIGSAAFFVTLNFNTVKTYLKSDTELSAANISDQLNSYINYYKENDQNNRTVMAELKNLNDVAYVRFAAVYRKFTDVGTFMDELQKLVDEKM